MLIYLSTEQEIAIICRTIFVILIFFSKISFVYDILNVDTFLFYDFLIGVNEFVKEIFTE